MTLTLESLVDDLLAAWYSDATDNLDPFIERLIVFRQWIAP